MTTELKTCVACRFYVHHPAKYLSYSPEHACAKYTSPVTGQTRETVCEFERAHGECGPSGRHWEKNADAQAS